MNTAYGDPQKKALLRSVEEGLSEKSGSDLLSHPVTRIVPSALEGLTSVFEMETGVAPPLSPPKKENNDNFTFATRE
jgi:hypothetical protein